MPTIKHLLTSLFAIAFVMSAVPAMAQKAGPNGGLMAGKDGHETELIISPTVLTVFLHENGKPDEVKGAKFRAVIQEGGNNTTVDFAVDGNKLVAKIAAPLGKGAVVVITGTDGDNHMISSRYVIN